MNYTGANLRLGSPFMRNYFTAFHYEQNMVQIARTKGSPDVVDYPPVPSPPPSDTGLGAYGWVGIILLIVVCILVLVIVGFYCYGKK
jgi:hypothetical protein